MKSEGMMKVLGCSGGLLLAMSGLAQAAGESFVVSGPLDVYVDLATLEESYDYSWVATVSYDPATAVVEIYDREKYVQAFFYETILSIEYSIYAADGSVVETGVEEAGLKDIASAVDDKDLNDSIREQIYWYAEDKLASLKTKAQVYFIDSSGDLVADASQYPQAPAAGAFEYGGGSFHRYNSLTGHGFEAHGRIVEVSTRDPVQDCSRNARRHGQFVGCAAHVLKRLKQAGELAGWEKGHWQSLVARLQELREEFRDRIGTRGQRDDSRDGLADIRDRLENRKDGGGKQGRR